MDLTRQLYTDYILSETLSVFIFQMTLCVGLLSTNQLPEYNEPPSRAVAFTRLMAGMIMQIKMSSELRQGLDKMKFAINHPWKFDKMKFAFIAGFCQVTNIIVVTFLNYFTIIDATTVIDVVMNFLALEVIADLDDIFFAVHSGDEIGVQMVLNEDGLYDKLLTIETTTSDDAEINDRDPDLEGINKFELSSASEWYEQLFAQEKGSLKGLMPKSLMIKFMGERDFWNKVGRVIYLFYRSLFVVVWYYFLPFFAIILQFVLI